MQKAMRDISGLNYDNGELEAVREGQFEAQIKDTNKTASVDVSTLSLKHQDSTAGLTTSFSTSSLTNTTNKDESEKEKEIASQPKKTITMPFAVNTHWAIHRLRPVFDSQAQLDQARTNNEDSPFWQHPVRYLPDV